MELLQTELSDSKQEVERLKSQLQKLQNVIIEIRLRVSYNFKCFIILLQMKN